MIHLSSQHTTKLYHSADRLEIIKFCWSDPTLKNFYVRINIKEGKNITTPFGPMSFMVLDNVVLVKDLIKYTGYQNSFEFSKFQLEILDFNGKKIDNIDWDLVLKY